MGDDNLDKGLEQKSSQPAESENKLQSEANQGMEELTARERDRVVALKEGKTESGVSKEFGKPVFENSIGTDEDAIAKILKDKTPEELAKLKLEYEKQYGQNLGDELSGEDRRKAKEVLDGDTKISKNPKADASAEKLHEAMAGIGTDEDAIFKELKGKTPKQIDEIQKSYEEKYGRKLNEDLRDELDDADWNRAKGLLDGRISKNPQADASAEKLHEAMSGWGTDEEAITKTLKGKTPQQIDAIKKSYEEMYGEKLTDNLRDELSTKELVELGPHLKPDFPTEKERLEYNIESKYKNETVKENFRKDMEAFEKRQPPVSAQEREEFYEQMNKLMEAKDPPAKAHLPKEAERLKLAREVMSHAANPDGIFQGSHGTCGAAALESRLYRTDPSAAAALVTEVATTGSFTPKQPPGSKPVEIHKSLVKPDEEAEMGLSGVQLDAARDYASQIFQGTSMQLVTPGYRQERQDPTNLSDTGERSNEGDNPGLEPQEVRDIERQVTGKDNAQHVLRSGDARDSAQFKQKLEEMQKNGELPAVVFVDGNKEPFASDKTGMSPAVTDGGHFVTITSYDPATGKVSYDNSWGAAADHTGEKAVPADQLYSAML